MYFHLFNRNTRKRIADCVAVMGIGAGIDHNAFRAVKISILYPVDDGAFMVALKHFQRTSFLLPFLGYHL
jgi:hypothetical protein